MFGKPANQSSFTGGSAQRALRLVARVLAVGGTAAALPVLAATIPPASSHELDDMLGWARRDGVKQVIWQTAEPLASNLCVYAVQPPKCDPERLKRIAAYFHVKGELSPLPTNYGTAPGYIIQAHGPSESGAVSCSEIMPRLSYVSGDVGYRPRDPQTNIPLMTVPTEEEALQKTLALLPVLGLTTNDLERHPNGSFRAAFRQETETYLETGSTRHKEMLRRRYVVLFQRVPGGENHSWTGAMDPHLGGGALEGTFTFRPAQFSGATSREKLPFFRFMSKKMNPGMLAPGEDLLAVRKLCVWRNWFVFKGKAPTTYSGLPKL